MKIVIDKNVCIGCGLCESTCEKCFKIKDAVATVINDGGNECDGCDIEEIVSNCPANAIKVEKQ